MWTQQNRKETMGTIVEYKILKKQKNTHKKTSLVPNRCCLPFVEFFSNMIWSDVIQIAFPSLTTATFHNIGRWSRTSAHDKYSHVHLIVSRSQNWMRLHFFFFCLRSLCHVNIEFILSPNVIVLYMELKWKIVQRYFSINFLLKYRHTDIYNLLLFTRPTAIMCLFN